ncbi:GtrA family protein [Diaphorobacter sp. HDW4B]|uniref:GtrA family protein n=1 Tax=Diaphorobacter sp. HDW4B TaxID=2714925 RepID=UPI00140D96B3|nr:GtrA family protein [Diaphorobacter sp. HDW4B]QIL70095.1 GtrA family protein [Diaphorobacter sp. HDW4B]
MNAITGLGTIAALTYFDVNPIIANMAGFAVGMLFSFTLAKFFVFRRRNNTKNQMRRYVISFVAAYGLNIFVLWIMEGRLHNGMAQIMAISTYVVLMYILMRFYIFVDN